MANEYLDLLNAQPAQPASTNPYADLLNEEERRRKSALAAQVGQALSVNPEQFNQNRKVAEFLGYPLAAVEALPEDSKRQAGVRRIQQDVSGIPALERKYTQADFAKLAHDDSGPLSAVGRVMGDLGIDVVKSLVGFPQAIVGIADIPTLGRVGRTLESVGYRPSEAQKLLDTLYSESTREAQRAVGEAEGFTGTMTALAQNPRALVSTIIQSLPQMIGGAAIARGILTAAPTLSPLFAAAAGEGTMAAGSFASNVRDENPDRVLTPVQSAAAIGAGAGTAVLGAAGGRLAARMGLGDIDTALASGSLTGVAKPGFAKQIVGQGISEGLFEELPQSVQEQMWQNFALDRPLLDRVGNAAAIGLAAGVATGGTFGAYTAGVSRLAGQALQQSENIEQAQRTAEAMQQAMAGAEASLLRERAPNEFRSLIGEMSQDGAFHVDAEVLNQMPPDVLQQLPGVLEALPDALATNSTVEIKLADALTVLPGTPQAQTFIENARRTPDAPSLVETEEIGKRAQEFLQQGVERVIAQAADQEALRVSQEAVKTNIKEQLTATGRFRDAVNEGYATWAAAFYTAYGSRLGMTPEQFYQRYPLRVLGAPQGQQTGVLNAAAEQITTPEFQAWFGDSKMVDNGRPLVLYHGTSDDVAQFDLNSPNRKDSGYLGTGVYLSDSVDMADLYATQKRRTGGAAPNIMPLYARLENPYIATDEDRARVRAGGREAADAFTAELQAQGYDGVIYQAAPDGREIVVFNPAAVKSVFNRAPTDAPGILEQRGVQAKGKAIPDSIDAVSNVEASFAFAGQQQFPNNRDFKLAIQARVLEAAKAAKVKLDEFTQGLEQYLVRIAVTDGQTALRTNANAVGWYNEKVTKALRLVSLIHPEVATDPQAKFAFVWAMAVTSNGLKVDKNFELAEKVYQGYKATGQMPTDVGIGTAAEAINRSLGLYNTLIAKHGFDVVERFMTTMQTAGEVEKFTGLPVSGENKTTMVYGAAALGPKIGNGFFMNLYGRFEQLTMDRWLMRTWGRWTATLVESNPAQVKAKRTALKALVQSLTPADKKAFEAIIGRKLTVGDIDAVGQAIWKVSQKPAKRKEMSRIGVVDEAGQARLAEILGEGKKGQVRVSIGDELRKGGIALTKYLDGQKEAPAGPPERGNIRKVFSQALAELQQQHPALTMSDFQALLWYPEKRLYDAAKSANEAADAYEDDEAPDYANAAAKLARSQGVPDADITAAIAAVDAELQSAVSAAGVRPGERGPGDSAGSPGQQVLEQGPRGTFNPQTLELVLNPNADLSTWFHETGHFFLEVLADVASQPDAPAQIVEDYNKVLAWFGVTPEQWAGFTLDEKRPYHERWAESIEQYVMEGKAPSVELQPVMRRFRAWMLSVYQSIKAFVTGKPELELNDDIRRVMDRMVATDEQIAQANEVAGLMPDEQADGEAAERLQKRSMADLKWTVRARDKIIKALQKQAETIRKGIRAEVQAEVEKMPLYRAMRWLKKGETTDPLTGDLVKATKGFGLNTQALAEMYPESALDRPDLSGLRGMTSKEGRPPDVVADIFEFRNGDVLVRSLLAAEPMADVVDAMTEQRMLEEHGDLVDERAIQDAANEAVHNEARARSLATELRSQQEMLGQRTDTGQTNARGARVTVNALVEAAKQFGANVVARTPLRDLKATAWKHTAAERRAGKRWTKATSAGKTDEAVQAKRDQVLNNAAARASIEAQAEARKILEFFKRVTKGNDEKTVEKGRDPDIVNAARAVLAAYGVKTRTTENAADYLERVKENDPATFAALLPMMTAALANAQPLEALTVEQLQGLNESIQAMWFLSKRSRQLEVDGDLLDIDDLAVELNARMEEVGIPATIPGETSAITAAEQRASYLQFVGALLRRVEQWAEAFDGRFGGPFLRFVFQPVKDAADRYRADRIEYRKRFQALVDGVAPFMPKGEIAAPELGYTFGRGHNGIGMAELLHAILHTGNGSNKRKLLLGRGWATENEDGTLDTRRWDNFLARLASEGKLRTEHYEFAQGVWDLMEQTKPLAQKTHRDVFGRYFAEVTAEPFVDPFGQTRAGGYVPAQADARIVRDAELRQLLEGENESMAYAFPQTNRGFTKSRTEYNRPLVLDLRTLPQHLDKVLLFSHMEPAVRGVRRLLARPAVSQPLGRIQPAAMTGMLIPWLNRASKQIVETPIIGDGRIARAASALRNRAGMALMFGNLSNTIQQITGLSGAAVKVKPSHLLRASSALIRDRKAMLEAVWAASPYMNDRANNEIAAMNQAMEQILLDASLYERAQDWTQKHAYFLQTAVDNVLSPVVWMGAYNQAIEEGMDERMAVRFADGVVRQTQGSTLPEDVSRIETGPAYARVFTQFIGYFNMMANTNGTALKQIAQDVGLKKGAGKAAYVVLTGFLLPIWIAEAIAIAFRGGPEDEDGDGYLDDWLAAVLGMGTIKGMFAQVPFVGQLANAGMNRLNDNPADDRVSLSPAVSLLEGAVGSPVSVYKAIVDDGNAQKAIRDVAALVSMATGLPASFAARSGGYLAGVASGDIQPTGPVDFARGVLTGVASPESR